MRRAVIGAVALWVAVLIAPAANADVLRVGTYNGIPGQYSSIQDAVAAAQPGDFILVAPGDYKTTGSTAPSDSSDTPAAVLMATPYVTLRGMDRNTVIVDGTKPGSPQVAPVQGSRTPREHPTRSRGQGSPQRVGPLPRAHQGTIARRNYPVRDGLSPLLNRR
jgi:hypothetical protein